jgi:hypothetical protein
VALEALYGLISAALGVLSGFQGIYERFPNDFKRAVPTIWGFLYLFTRGGMGALAYAVGPRFIPTLASIPLLRAIACGFAAEAILRSQFYIMRSAKGKKKPEDLRLGVLDGLRFYQDFFLTSIDDHLKKPGRLAVEQAAARFASFHLMYELLEERKLGWDLDKPQYENLVKEAADLATNFSSDYEKAINGAKEKIDKTYRLILGYLVKKYLGLPGLADTFES